MVNIGILGVDVYLYLAFIHNSDIKPKLMIQLQLFIPLTYFMPLLLLCCLFFPLWNITR